MSPKVFLCLAPFLVGCIHKPTADHLLADSPNPPPPPSPTAVAACEKTREWQNIWTITGTLASGLAGSGGAADALDKNTTVQTGVGVTVIVMGVLAAVSTTASGIDANTYATDNCSSILQQAANAGTFR
jgi:hypothetical protein